MKVFSPEWAEAYRTAINNNSAYRDASSKWEEGAVSIVLKRDSASIGVWLDLLKGECKQAISLFPTEAHEKSTFVIEADESTWREVLGGKLQPLMGIMRGKLKLTKGSLAKLLPHTKGATELVNSAQVVPTDFE